MRLTTRNGALLFSLLCASCAHLSERKPASPASAPAGAMIKGISVAYVHTPNKRLADWYEKTLGLEKGYGDEGWQSFEMPRGSDFALDFISYPSSIVQKQSVMISFLVDDINAVVRELAKRGVRFYPDNDPARTVFDAGSAFVATFEDPDGNWVQISQPKKK